MLCLVVLIILIIVWSVRNDAEDRLDTSNPLLPEHHINKTIGYGPMSKDAWFTFETWNCALVPYTPYNAEPYPSRDFLSHRCNQLKVTRLLILPLLVVSSLSLVMSILRSQEVSSDQGRVANQGASGPLLGFELEDNCQPSERGHFTDPIYEVHALHRNELSVARPCAPELPGGGALQLPGDESLVELEADEVAVEL